MPTNIPQKKSSRKKKTAKEKALYEKQELIYPGENSLWDERVKFYKEVLSSFQDFSKTAAKHLNPDLLEKLQIVVTMALNGHDVEILDFIHVHQTELTLSFGDKLIEWFDVHQYTDAHQEFMESLKKINFETLIRKEEEPMKKKKELIKPAAVANVEEKKGFFTGAGTRFKSIFKRKEKPIVAIDDFDPVVMITERVAEVDSRVDFDYEAYRNQIIDEIKAAEEEKKNRRLIRLPRMFQKKEKPADAEDLAIKEQKAA